MNPATQKSHQKDVEAIYPLSPGQQEMFFDCLSNPESKVYLSHLQITLQGNLDLNAFQLAWQKVIERHGILRTCFVWKKVKTPLQVVRKNVTLPWFNYDWRNELPEEQNQKIDDLLKSDKERDFEFNKAPLLRCHLIRLAEDKYEFIKTVHHLLLEGWSRDIILKEVFDFYGEIIQNKPVVLVNSRPYKDYINGIQQQDELQSKTLSFKPPSSNSELIPISLTQLELWFFAQLHPESCVYNLACIYRIGGLLNVPALEKSLREIVKRHQILRTNFICLDGKVFQKISPEPLFDFSIIDLQGMSQLEQEREAKRLIAIEIEQPFDLEKGSLFRSKMIKLTDNNYLLVMAIHHIIYDGWSSRIFAKELSLIYEAFCQGKPSPLPELPIQYADFARWQWQSLENNSWQSELDFWKKHIGINPPILKLPTDYPRTRIQLAESAVHTFLISQDLTDTLKVFSYQEEATLYMTLLAAFKALLFYYTQQTEIIVGGVIANRNQPETQDLIGLMIQFLPLYTHLEAQVSFRDLLNQVKEMSLEFQTHQEVPFITLVEELKPIRDPQYAVFHQVIFVFQNIPKQDLKLANLTVKDESLKMYTPAHSAEEDLSLYIQETEQGLEVTFVYKTHLFRSETITKMGEHFQELLKNIVTAPHKPISDLCPLSEPERFSINTSPLSSSINTIKSNDFIKPRNLTEETMVNIWKEVLKLEQISIDDNFFELGGNSQKVLRIIDKISKNIQINCPLRDFFENPTIASLVATLDQESFKDL